MYLFKSKIGGKKMKLIKYMLLFLILISNATFAQDKNFLQEFVRYKLTDKNVLTDFNQYDFSNIWTTTKESSIYGIIGNKHQRIRIKFLSVSKNPKHKNQYIVYGKSKVKNNICDFQGTITLKKILLAKNFDNGIDQMYQGKLQKQGVLIADYLFKEDKNHYGCGIFSGKSYAKWVIYKDTAKKISYDDIGNYADGYQNNAFIGTWKSYKTNKIKKCHWGDWRVPMANADFDWGVGDFSPSDKYLKFGWESYRNAMINNDKHAKKIEYQEWWKD